MSKHHWLSLSLVTLALGCAEQIDLPPTEEASPAPVRTTTQAVLDDGPNWFVAGNGGRVELIGGTDGEPDALTGRFVLEGRAVRAAASTSTAWVVAGDGVSQPLDDEAFRQRETRTVLSGESVEFVAPAADGDFVAGGGAGRFQRLDAQGEPTQDEIVAIAGTTLTGAAQSGTGTWLVGGQNGEVVVVSETIAAPQVAPVSADGGAAVVDVVVGPGTPAWFALTADSIVEVSALGNPGSSSAIAGGNVTTAVSDAQKILVGTSDGRVGVANNAANPTFAFTDVVSGGAVVDIVGNGTDWLVLGDNGFAQLLDANGSPKGQAVRISGEGRALVGAHWVASESAWRIVVGEIAFVAFVDENLAPPRDLTPVMGGANILDASAGSRQVLVVGEGGAFQVVDDRGAAVSAVGSAGGAALNAAEWNGTNWLVAGDGGFVARVDESGMTLDAGTTLLDGADIQLAAWSGEFWLVGGDGGAFQFVRFDGTASGGVRTVADVASWNDARWNGFEWMIVGEASDGTGVVALVAPDQNAEPQVTALPTMGPLSTVDYNGIEWLVGGVDGMVQRINAQGMTVDQPFDVLNGFDVHEVYFNGTYYLVTGEFGAVRRLGLDYQPVRTPISVIDRADASVVVWTDPRGFPEGPCITDEVCYRGPCVGGLTVGRCCDAACDRPCESCFEDDTGEADGTCAPVVAGKRPPARDGASDACTRQSEATCGFTGVCDGAGDCQYYGAEIECAASVCTLGSYTPVATCDGTGACGAVTQVDCAPYAGCDEETGCLDSCTSDQDCVGGFECVEAACVEESDGGPGTNGGTNGGGGGGGDEPGGCCSTTPANESGTALLLGLLFVAGRLRRRR